MGIGLGAVVSAIYNKLISEPQRGCRQIYIFFFNLWTKQGELFPCWHSCSLASLPNRNEMGGFAIFSSDRMQYSE